MTIAGNVKGTAAIVAGGFLSLLLLPLSGLKNRGLHKLIVACSSVLILALVAAGAGGCAGNSSSSSATPKGNYTVTVTATSGSLAHTATYSLTVQ